MPFAAAPKRSLAFALPLIAAASALATNPAAGEALLLIEADSGKVLHAHNAAYPWYPASVTKLMTAYITLRAVKEGRLALNTPIAVSDRAAAQQPSKMGFKIGTQVTVDNALKMLMVKSANDMAVVLAEGVSGSVEEFSEEMNRASRRLGMTQSSWVNPNGLPAEEQVTSARDMAILARAILRELPEYELYWRIPAIKFGKKVLRNYNNLIDRYPGADGMKTGFICASGFNLVASATRGGKRLIAVVFGSYNSRERGETAAQLLEKGFNGGGLSWLMPSLGTVESMQPIAAAPPNLREEMCGKKRRKPASESEEEEEIVVSTNTSVDPSSPYSILPNYKIEHRKKGALLGERVASMPPIPVFVGPAKKPAAPIETAVAARAAPGAQTPAAAFAPGQPVEAGVAAASPWPAFFAAGASSTPAAAPAATAARPVVAAVPMPRPRPKRR